MRVFGLDPVKTYQAIRFTPRYLFDFIQFIAKNDLKSKLTLSPALLDFSEKAGSADGHYFWQDLITARWIFSENPLRHLDVGSRIDGFVSHLLSFRDVTVLDIREGSSNITGLTTLVGNAQLNLASKIGRFDSVSTLHSIEHFGLGRYGDPIDPEGHLKGLKNIADCVEVEGSFYVSFPIGNAVVEFNSQRVIDPQILESVLTNFELKSFVLIPWRGTPVRNIKLGDVNLKIHGQAGLFHLIRKF